MIVYGVILNSAEITLSEAMTSKGFEKLDNVNIVVEKNKYSLNLYSDTTLIKSYKVVFGRNEKKKKIDLNDQATPVGEYKICDIKTEDNYYKFFKLNYPNKNDASEALRNGIISRSEFISITEAQKEGLCSPADTRLGSNIGIHGIGKYNYIFKNLPFIFNWTNGSVALSNENIDELYSVVEIGTKVVIK
jgi:murein L,D-transpeptidase YafK